uniref:Auto-transporter adhesin head GIN domain-containing protein n=1 Tax=Alexandrium catenella TaxID=2925 RepID=A0A7S1SBJ4_ALECA|mmetsp:Transcript_9365/g.25342  ORF Transcript_9365/g.25342 Transcript_9365/m.25342 type:complete len:269 (+) Transcript_9365:86-892(+)
MAARTLLFFGAALFAFAQTALAVEEERTVAHFTGISVSDGIVVHANTTANASADGTSSLVLSGAPDAVSGVRSHVDVWGTLILSRAPGASHSDVVATAVVSGPLTYAGATSRGNLTAYAVSGTVIVSSRSTMDVGKLDASRPTSIVASSESSLKVSSGHVPFLSVSCSALSSMALAGLQADSASIAVSAKSSVAGVALGSATVSVSSQSLLSMVATQSVGLSCTTSEVYISGGAAVTPYSNDRCTVDISSTQAAMPPPRRLDAATVFL